MVGERALEQAEPTGVVTETGRRARRATRAAGAGLVLLAVYVALSFANDADGFLGTDTGGKVATLRAMDARDTLDPDVGYWAEAFDPDGRLHPLYYTTHIGERWVNVTTLPAVVVGFPLFELGGYRAALLLPMLGAVAAAFAARALARRISTDERLGWHAFWLAGLASPLTVYALDFWEHTLGVAFVAWGIVLLIDVARGEGVRLYAPLSGVLFGIAATMRTEALVYGAVASATACVLVLLRRRRLIATVGVGFAIAAGVALPLLGNVALERAVVDGGIRAPRATGTVSSALTEGEDGRRAEEALLTTFALRPVMEPPAYVVGVGLFALLAFVALRALAGGSSAGPAVLAAAAACSLYALRFGDGAGFVPGLFSAAPIAVVGVTRGWRHPVGRAACGAVLLALPLVWMFQYTGGAGPQWGGRYVLTTGLVLAAVGAASLPQLAKWARATFVAISIAVTAFGLLWLSIRSHDVAQASRALDKRSEAVLVSTVAHLAREGGGVHDFGRWLTAVSDDDQRLAAEVVLAAGLDDFALVELDRRQTPPEFAGFRRRASESMPLFSGVDLRVTRYEAT